MINSKKYLTEAGFQSNSSTNKYSSTLNSLANLPIFGEDPEGYPYYAPDGSSDVPIQIEDARYSGVGTTFKNRANKPKNNSGLNPNQYIKNEYSPVMNTITGYSKGTKMLATIMAMKEGFYPDSRSYRTNNPGNIGNTDAGGNNNFGTLKDGITAQLKYLIKVAEGKHRGYPLNVQKNIKPYKSPEIARNVKSYGITPYLPGYKFKYTGKLSQFIKIYATGARAGNNYLSYIVSFFKTNGENITENTTLKKIISINNNKSIVYN